MDGQPPPDPQEPGCDVAEALIGLTADWAAALVAGDAARIAGFMAEEWVSVSSSGIAPREQFLSLVESGELTHSAMRYLGPPRVRVHGDTALVTGRITNTAHYRGERLDADEWTTDVFVRRDGRWQCVLTHLTAAAPDRPGAQD
ncbi:nuclear transport factor 2 family protein [Streptomyces sclerotialus]|uniref:nuclear transport factor 2 family protein n=1 Tax=Streptomyces sclerotialus TaxID=1957 RepID=UPI0004C880FE